MSPFLGKSADPVSELLAQWRLDLDAEVAPALRRPFPRLARRVAPWRRRTAVVTGLSLAVLTGGGVAAAHPGDLLYPVRKAVAGPRDDTAAREVRDLLRLAATDPAEAAALLDTAAHRLPAVGDSDRRAGLSAQLAREPVAAALAVAPAPAPVAAPEQPDRTGPPPPTGSRATAPGPRALADRRKQAKPTKSAQPTRSAKPAQGGQRRQAGQPGESAQGAQGAQGRQRPERSRSGHTDQKGRTSGESRRAGPAGPGPARHYAGREGE